jgi:hypothetical protein
MASTLPAFMNREVPKWQQALRLTGPNGDNVLTDSVIGPLTTVAGVIAALNSGYATPKGINDLRNCRAAIEAMTYLGPTAAYGYNIILDADVAAANTFDGLMTAIVTNSGISTDEQEFSTNIVGNTQYLGNSQGASNI